MPMATTLRTWSGLITALLAGSDLPAADTGWAMDQLVLGVPLDLSPADSAKFAADIGLSYLFAPRFNPALRHVAVVRRELAVPTAFNVLAPLLNPADPQHQLVGVANACMLPVLAEALAKQ